MKPRVLYSDGAEQSANVRVLSASAVAEMATTSAAAVPDAPPVRLPRTPSHDVLAGAAARAASQSTIHPLDTVKVRMQVPETSARPANLASRSRRSSDRPFRPGDLQRFTRRAAVRISSLYRGVWGAASGASLAMAFYFASYGVVAKALETHTKLSVGAVAFISGAAGAIGSSVVKIPAAVCIRSVQANVYPNVWTAARRIVKAVGPLGLYTGYIPTLLEDVPDMAVKFAVYEMLQNAHFKVTQRRSNQVEDLAFGGLAGAAAAASTTPLDVVKTHMMCTAAGRPSMRSAFNKVVQNGGNKALWRGVGPRALCNGINSAVFFCFFELSRSLISQYKANEASRKQEGRAGLWQEGGMAMQDAWARLQQDQKQIGVIAAMSLAMSSTIDSLKRAPRRVALAGSPSSSEAAPAPAPAAPVGGVKSPKAVRC
eukprot:jgi/Mesvir1/23392/Mv21087-RA.1